MKIMLIEDASNKSRSIISHLKSRGVLEKDIIHAKNMTDFAAHLNSDIGLFIIDFNIPNINDGAAQKNGRAILESIVKAGKLDALLLAISSYPNEFPDLRQFYESNGCILADFSNKKGWQSTLDHLLTQLKKNIKFDFLIFCALQEERNPYIVFSNDGQQTIRGGIDCYDIVIGDRKGTIVLLPQMGLVNAAITASLCIDRFRPSVIGMSGICGGIEGRAQLGQLFISAIAFEYQSGKWASDGFKQEPYQVPADHITITELRALINSDDLIVKLEEGFRGERPKNAHKPAVGLFASGSAVIADEDHLKQIEETHRKVNAIDMEVYAIHRAAELSLARPSCICAKTVVDLCNKEKSDGLHLYGSYISAKFLITAVGDFFSRHS